MAIDFTTDIVTAFYAGQVSNEAAYQAPGTYGIPTTYISSANEKELLCMIEVLRAYFANVGSSQEARLAQEIILRMVQELQTGAGTTYSAANNAVRAQAAAMHYYAKHVRNPSL